MEETDETPRQRLIFCSEAKQHTRAERRLSGADNTGTHPLPWSSERGNTADDMTCKPLAWQLLVPASGTLHVAAIPLFPLVGLYVGAACVLALACGRGRCRGCWMPRERGNADENQILDLNREKIPQSRTASWRLLCLCPCAP